MFEMTNKTYDFLKAIALYILPALATLYLALAGIWGLPYGDQISGTIMAIDTFLGVVLKISNDKYKEYQKMTSAYIVAGLGVISVILGIISTAYGLYKSNKKQIQEDDSVTASIKESLLKLNLKSDQICSTTNDTRADLKSIQNNLDGIKETQLKHGIYIDQLQKDVEELKKVN